MATSSLTNAENGRKSVSVRVCDRGETLGKTLSMESNEFHTDLQEMTANVRNNCGLRGIAYYT